MVCAIVMLSLKATYLYGLHGAIAAVNDATISAPKH